MTSPRARGLLEASAWANVPRVSILSGAGFHEAAGAVALATAAAVLQGGRIEDVLVVAGASESFSFVRLGRPGAS